MSTPVEGRKYAVSLWDCFSPFSICLKTSFCPCFVAGQNHHRAKGLPLSTYKSFNSGCLGWCGLSLLCLAWQMQFRDREMIRKAHDLEGDGCSTGWTVIYCGCCELIQTKKQLDHIEALRQDDSDTQSQKPQYAANTGYHSQSPMIAAPSGHHNTQNSSGTPPAQDRDLPTPGSRGANENGDGVESGTGDTSGTTGREHSPAQDLSPRTDSSIDVPRLHQQQDGDQEHQQQEQVILITPPTPGLSPSGYGGGGAEEEAEQHEKMDESDKEAS